MNAQPKKIFVVGGHQNYANWIPGALCYSLDAAEIVVFAGGTDIQSWIYGKKANPLNEKPDVHRDKFELEAFEKAYAQKKFLIGICRGAQFLCAVAGGILVQHQNHPKRHKLTTEFGEIPPVTSDHHQRQHPFDMPPEDYKLLAWTTGLSPFNQGVDAADVITSPDSKEAEVVWYPKIKALAIQSHPEWMYPPQDENDRAAIDWFKSLVYKYQDL